jgi:N-acetyl-gamma-glutamylphosphate reductase
LIQLASSANPAVRAQLAAHPRVERVAESESPGVEFTVDGWHRKVLIDDLTTEPRGIVEMMDNNPMVCADAVSVPSGVSTLALIAFGPLIDAGILLEPPTLAVSCDLQSEFDVVPRWLGSDVVLHHENRDLGSVIAATAIAAITTPANWDDIDSLYAERFERSFYVRREEDLEWSTALVAHLPYAVYQMRYSPGGDASLLTINLLADQDGKAGAAQVVHAMNVMCGFEESLGVA